MPRELDQYWTDGASAWMLTSRASREKPTLAQAQPAQDEPWAEATDEAVVEAVRAGRPGAFDVLVARHQRTIYRVCYRFVGSHEDASDLTQDVFLRAFRGLAAYRGQAAFKTWLYRIAINVGLNRRSVRGPGLDQLDDTHAPATPAPDIDERLDRLRRAARVRDAVKQLPPRQRAAIVVKVFQDLSHEEAAGVLGCSVGTVKANVFHALKRLRRLLGTP